MNILQDVAVAFFTAVDWFYVAVTVAFTGWFIWGCFHALAVDDKHSETK